MKLKDERVEQYKNKIYAEFFQYAYLFITASFVIKSLYFNMDLTQCSTEFVIMITAPLYQMVRTRQLGVVLATDLRKQMSLKRNITGAIMGFVLFFLLWLSSGKRISTEFAVSYVVT